MENFCANAKSFFEGWSANWQNHELLNVDVVVSMLATVDDVHHWNWKCFSVESAKVNVQVAHPKRQQLREQLPWKQLELR